MKIQGTYRFRLAQQDAWNALFDPVRLAQCLPGCENFELVGEQTYVMTLTIGIGTIKASYEGKVQLYDVEAPNQYRMAVESKSPGGFVQGDGLLILTPDEDNNRTTVTYEGDVQLGGPIASVGQRMVQAAGKMLIKRFFKKMERSAGVEDAEDDEPTGEPTETASEPTEPPTAESAP